MLRPLLATTTCALALGLAACGGDDEQTTAAPPPKPAYCTDVEQLRSAATGLTDLELDTSIGTQLRDRVTTLREALADVRQSGKDEFADETAALETALTEVGNDLERLTTGGIAALPEDLLALAGAVDDLVAAVRTRCDEPATTTTS